MSNRSHRTWAQCNHASYIVGGGATKGGSGASPEAVWGAAQPEAVGHWGRWNSGLDPVLHRLHSGDVWLYISCPLNVMVTTQPSDCQHIPLLLILCNIPFCGPDLYLRTSIEGCL